ncbi:MAG TPA: glycosyltransferase family 39 protein [Candidatus Polarisedimenticolaceae bacterium]|nr:glycosyltransferase family 39 protein [Candidatus Polarisedimenticolaceae bacterium]
MLYLACLGARDLWNPNEPTYGLAVREMAERGSWLLPTVNGEPFAEKPPLYFWLARLAALVAGVNETTLRLPSALAGLLGVIGVYRLAARRSTPSRGTTAAALYATTYIVYWSARQVQMDLLLSVATLGAVLEGVRALEAPPPAWRSWALCGAAAGVGILAKGPLGLIAPALALVPWAFLERRARALVQPGPLLAGAIALAIGAPWYLLLWANGETAALHELVVRQNLTRFVAAWDHREGWSYYLVRLWIDMAPWVFFLPLAWRLPDRDADERRLDRLAWIWLGATLLFFSLSASKRSPYLLPAAPAVALLVSGVAVRAREGRLGPRRRALGAVILAALGLDACGTGLALAVRWLPRLPALGAAGKLACALLLGGGACLLATLALPRTRRAAPRVALGLVVLLYFAAGCVVLPALDEYKSARGFCAEVLARVPPERPLRAYGLWRWRGSYAYYTGRAIPRLATEDELRRYWEQPEPVFLIVERPGLERVTAALGPQSPLVSRAIGDGTAFLLSNQ